MWIIAIDRQQLCSYYQDSFVAELLVLGLNTSLAALVNHLASSTHFIAIVPSPLTLCQARLTVRVFILWGNIFTTGSSLLQSMKDDENQYIFVRMKLVLCLKVAMNVVSLCSTTITWHHTIIIFCLLL